jgi:uncharacterized protein YxjI
MATGLLNRKTIFVREHVGLFKAANAYDLLDPETKEVVGRAQEKVRGFFTKMLKFTNWKTRLSFTIDFHDASGGDAVVLTVHRPFTWFRSLVSVSDTGGRLIGQFKQKLLAIGPKMWILDPSGKEIGMLSGNWTGWNLEVKDASGRVLSTVTKKWAGIGQELFTSADNYVIDLSDDVGDADLRRLLFAAPITADMVYKEYS